MKDNIIGFCVYCKGEIYADEPFVKSGENLYHASENENHDNCWKLIIKDLEE